MTAYKRWVSTLLNINLPVLKIGPRSPTALVQKLWNYCNILRLSGQALTKEREQTIEDRLIGQSSDI